VTISQYLRYPQAKERQGDLCHVVVAGLRHSTTARLVQSFCLDFRTVNWITGTTPQGRYEPVKCIFRTLETNRCSSRTKRLFVKHLAEKGAIRLLPTFKLMQCTGTPRRMPSLPNLTEEHTHQCVRSCPVLTASVCSYFAYVGERRVYHDRTTSVQIHVIVKPSVFVWKLPWFQINDRCPCTVQPEENDLISALHLLDSWLELPIMHQQVSLSITESLTDSS
jgi:hypothetical protein